jgi:hypothetical protein
MREQDALGLIARRDGVDLVIITAGIGHENPDLAWPPEAETIASM